MHVFSPILSSRSQLQTRLPSRYNLSRRQWLTQSAVLSLALTLCALGLGSWYWSKKEPVAILPNLYSVLLDSSDPLSVSQQTSVLADLERHWATHLKQGDRLVIARLNHAKPDGFETLFNKVDPGKGSEVNPWLETPILAEQQRESTFSKPYQTSLETAQQPNPQPFTPLIKSIASFSTALQLDKNYQTKQIIIISDGLEHDKYSIYRKNLYTPQAKQYLTKQLANLNGFQVKFYRVRSASHSYLQDDTHKQWLDTYLRASGAQQIEMIDLVGL